MKHTPGPWRVYQSKRFPTIAINGDKGSVRVANTYGELDFQRQMANARLIAAAPAMYKALEDAPHFDEQSVGQFLNEYREWHGNVRQTVLARARGEES